MHILHEKIGPPQIKVAQKTKTTATVIVAPLPPGFGVTVGNVMRRVLLSSLPGTAVTAIKIDGVTHEYDTIPGVKDSVLDITLNLRGLQLKKSSKGVEVVEIPFVKSGKVTAKDLKVSSDIEILNPSQVITTCDKADAKKKMHIRVEKGVGYRLVNNEDNVAEKDKEFILIDANFSPVLHAEYSIEPMRVGDLTNLDRLVISVTTNGALEAENSVKLAAKMLQNYFEIFNKTDAYSDEDFVTEFDILKQQLKKSEEMAAAAAGSSESMETPIDILGLSQRTLNALINGGINTLEKLLSYNMTMLAQLRGFGQKAKDEITKVLEERGYTLQA